LGEVVHGEVSPAMSTSQVELAHIPEIARATFDNLMQLYLHDMSEYTDLQVNEEGLYPVSEYVQRYWQERGRHPFFIRTREGIAGFALVRELEKNCYSIAEFFVIRKLRRSGVGKSAAFQLFDRFAGEWHIAQEEQNSAAQEFWCTILAEYTGGDFEQTTQDAHPRGPKQIFRSRSA